ncbi:MAG TPA: hypothetical protein VM077_04280 [Candidatus Limnocylindrales bacterium]|nr:hypothetical protein [Candidatus Limnocylindrales bacterium]
MGSRGGEIPHSYFQELVGKPTVLLTFARGDQLLINGIPVNRPSMRKEGSDPRVTEKKLDILRVLAERPGEMLTKYDLVEELDLKQDDSLATSAVNAFQLMIDLPYMSIFGIPIVSKGKEDIERPAERTTVSVTTYGITRFSPRIVEHPNPPSTTT